MRSRYNLPPEKMARWLAEGRGQGVGLGYRPWLTVGDVPSTGLSYRIWGLITPRVHHLFSRNEEKYFLWLEWRKDVIDIREQYPLLPIEETIEIAMSLGVKHIRDRAGNLVPFTDDFVITFSTPNGPVNKVRAIKPAAELNSDKVWAKFAVHQANWERRGVDWGVVPDTSVPTVMADNVRIIRNSRDIPACGQPLAAHIGRQLTCLIDRHPVVPIRHLTADCDKKFGCAPGTSLAVLWHLIAKRQLEVNMSVPLDTNRPLAVLRQAGRRAISLVSC